MEIRDSVSYSCELVACEKIQAEPSPSVIVRTNRARINCKEKSEADSYSREVSLNVAREAAEINSVKRDPSAERPCACAR